MRSPPRGSRSAACLLATRPPAPQPARTRPGGPRARASRGETRVDQTDPVFADEVALAQRRGRPDRLVERSGAATARIRKAVEEQDHVGVPLGVELVDPEVAAARAGAPVDSPDPVAGGERSQIRE